MVRVQEPWRLSHAGLGSFSRTIDALYRADHHRSGPAGSATRPPSECLPKLDHRLFIRLGPIESAPSPFSLSYDNQTKHIFLFEVTSAIHHRPLKVGPEQIRHTPVTRYITLVTHQGSPQMGIANTKTYGILTDVYWCSVWYL